MRSGPGVVLPAVRTNNNPDLRRNIYWWVYVRRDSGLEGARKGVLGATLVRVETIVKVD